VEVAVQADAYTLVLGLRGLEGKTALHVSWHPDAARVSLGPPPPRVHKSENLSFGEQAQAVLRNLILVEASIPEPWERVAVFGFAARPGDPVAIRLRVETQGRNSNAMLTSEDDADADDVSRAGNRGRSKQGTILACAYQVGASQTSVRPSSPGFAYQPPPPAPGISPDAFGEIPGGLADVVAFREAVTAAAKAKKRVTKKKKKTDDEAPNETPFPPPGTNGNGSERGRFGRGRSGRHRARVARGLPRAGAVVAQGRRLRRRRRRLRSLRRGLGRGARRVDGVGARDAFRRVLHREARRLFAD
jgi:hypothetical protein